MAEEPPVQDEGVEGSEGAGREQRPRKGEVEPPWPFPAQPQSVPSFRLQRGGVGETPGGG